MRSWVLKGIFAAGIAYGATSCTGDQPDDATPEVSKDEAAAPAVPEPALDGAAPAEDTAAPDGGEPKADPGPGLDAMDAAQPDNAITSTEEPPAKATPPRQPVAATPAPRQPPPAKELGKGKKSKKTRIAATPGGRVVRYVKADAIAIRGQASETAPTVGHLGKGDIVMVVEDGDWGRIADNMYVRLSALSSKAVPRPVGKEASWTPPKG